MKQNRINVLLAVILILAAAMSRVILYPNNFSPIIGMALFGGAIIKDKRFAFVLPLLAMFVSDCMFEFSGIANGFWGWGQLVGYAILGVITVFGFRLKKVNALNVIAFSLISSVIFFVLSNLSFFLIDNKIYHTYSNDLAGLKNCYVQALPFFKWHVDLTFSVILFGTYYLATQFAFNNNKRVTA
ncbi:MAG: hypothetical protein JST81_09525 [Bacteroidetes bacterium]|jgi:hypothetical protein|nr:hypothetical protein [Bacteroidota bacterium]